MLFTGHNLQVDSNPSRRQQKRKFGVSIRRFLLGLTRMSMSHSAFAFMNVHILYIMIYFIFVYDEDVYKT